jgi:hypothetical protein
MYFDSAVKAWRSPRLSVGHPVIVPAASLREEQYHRLTDDLTGSHAALHAAISPPRLTLRIASSEYSTFAASQACSEAPARPNQRTQ